MNNKQQKTGLYYIRNLYGITMEKLSDDILKVGKATISKYESGKIPISNVKLMMLSRYFDDIEEDYFCRILSEKDKIHIQRIKLDNDIDRSNKEDLKDTVEKFFTKEEKFNMLFDDFYSGLVDTRIKLLKEEKSFLFEYIFDFIGLLYRISAEIKINGSLREEDEIFLDKVKILMLQFTKIMVKREEER